MRLSRFFMTGSEKPYLSPKKNESQMSPKKTGVDCCLNSSTVDTVDTRSQSVDDIDEKSGSLFLESMKGSMDFDNRIPQPQVDEERIICRLIATVGSTVDASGKPFTIYLLSIGSDCDEMSTWIVYRRYSQFLRFHDRLSRLLQQQKEVNLPKLPPRIKLFETKAVVRMRLDLEVWVKEVQSIIFMLGQNQMQARPETVAQLDRAMTSFLSHDCDKCPTPFKVLWQVSTSSDDELSQEGASFCSTSRIRKVSLNDFQLVQVIGKGAFGKVSLVRKKSDQRLYAMKTIEKRDLFDDKRIDSARCERRLLENVSHPFIAKMHFAFQTTHKLFFVLEYAAGGELFFHLSQRGTFPERVTRFFCAELILALEYLHDKGIIYRDLKPENILLDAEGHVKLVDFGLAKVGISSPTEGARSFVGTYQYLAPEVICRQGHGFAVDWWALGMVAYEMLTGLPPWYTDDQPVLFDRICNATLRFPRSVARTPATFIAALLQRDPALRLGNDIAAIKNHNFFIGMHWDGVLSKEITPPFCPCPEKRQVEDAMNFAEEFKCLTVDDYEHCETLEKGEQGAPFEFFTFQEEETYLDTLREQFARTRIEV